MEIRTADSSRRAQAAAADGPPDRGAYLRRKTSQKLRTRQLAGRRMIGALKMTVRLAAVAAAAAALMAAYWYASSSGRFALRSVTCEGCAHVQPGQLESVIRREFADNILQIDLERLHERLEKEIWIKEVEIRRVLPGTLVLYVLERVPAVIAELNGDLVLTDREGVLLDQYAARYGKLDAPVFSGLLGENAADYRNFAAENAARISLGLRVLTELESGSPDYTGRISEIDLSDTTNVRVLLVDDTAEVLLGDRDFLKRFRTFQANMPQFQELKDEYSEIATVDLRYDGKIIYRPRNLAAAPVEAVEARRQ
jgi:cell division septal protein FtsQ